MLKKLAVVVAMCTMGVAKSNYIGFWSDSERDNIYPTFTSFVGDTIYITAPNATAVITLQGEYDECAPFTARAPTPTRCWSDFGIDITYADGRTVHLSDVYPSRSGGFDAQLLSVDGAGEFDAWFQRAPDGYAGDVKLFFSNNAVPIAPVLALLLLGVALFPRRNK